MPTGADVLPPVGTSLSSLRSSSSPSMCVWLRQWGRTRYRQTKVVAAFGWCVCLWGGRAQGEVWLCVHGVVVSTLRSLGIVVGTFENAAAAVFFIIFFFAENAPHTAAPSALRAFGGLLGHVGACQAVPRHSKCTRQQAAHTPRTENVHARTHTPTTNETRRETRMNNTHSCFCQLGGPTDSPSPSLQTRCRGGSLAMDLSPHISCTAAAFMSACVLRAALAGTRSTALPPLSKAATHARCMWCRHASGMGPRRRRCSRTRPASSVCAAVQPPNGQSRKRVRHTSFTYPPLDPWVPLCPFGSCP